ncbi:MAG: chloride channel protein [Candidatus Thermoplasmatota archaeon]|nr:chloride channel protein [Candidatus Thermoplasmatota archaeon]MCL5954822.1 chloride channel protein [Candidatus Thermoplasmatota archaeon]
MTPLKRNARLSQSIKQMLDKGTVGKWVLVGLLIGIIAGVGSLALYEAIAFFSSILLTGITGLSLPVEGIAGQTPAYSLGHYKLLLIPVSTVLGGLISGFIVYRFAPEAEGHGTDATISAFHYNNGKIRRRIPLVKLVSSAITIGSGGSAGREGPIAQISAGFGSFVADAFKLSDHDRRIAMAAGIGAGIGSIFMAPLGGALLSTEVLYRQDFEVEALIPSIIASITGYAIFGYAFAYQPLFTIPGSTYLGFSHPEALLIYLMAGIIAGFGGILYVKTFYGIQSLFLRMRRIPKYFRPAIGGLLVGLIAIEYPQILGLGYGWIQLIFFNNLALLPLYVLIILFFLKIIATSLTIGSGGSGGVFAPGIVTGAFLGAAMGVVIHPYFPYINVAELTIVTMISFFGGISKAPISVLIMGTEMTGGFGLFLPLMLATTVSYFVSGSKYSIYRAQVKNREASPAHRAEYEKPVMDQVSVYDAMVTSYPSTDPDQPLNEVMSLLRSTRTKTIVVERDHLLFGTLSIENIRSDMPLATTKVKDVMTTDTSIITQDENIHIALDMLTRTTSGKLVVVDSNDRHRVLGTIGFADVAEAYNREVRKIKLRQMEQT